MCAARFPVGARLALPEDPVNTSTDIVRVWRRLRMITGGMYDAVPVRVDDVGRIHCPGGFTGRSNRVLPVLPWRRSMTMLS